jgi:hypothetical protein
MSGVDTAFINKLVFSRVDTSKLACSEQPIAEVACSVIGIIGRGNGGVYIGRAIRMKVIDWEIFKQEFPHQEVVTDFNVRLSGEELLIDYNPGLCQVWERI